MASVGGWVVRTVLSETVVSGRVLINRYFNCKLVHVSRILVLHVCSV